MDESTRTEPQPILCRLFESIAAVMELDEGRQTLELEFEDGRLVKWYSHSKANYRGTLARFDGRAAWIAGAVREPQPEAP